MTTDSPMEWPSASRSLIQLNIFSRVCVCVCTCVYACAHMCVGVHMHVCVSVCLHMCVHVCVCTLRVCTWGVHTCV